MKDEPIKILCCGDLESEWITEAGNNNIRIDILHFTEIKPVINSVKKQQIQSLARENHNVVFTSKNAVTAVISALDNDQPNWNIYCTANATKDAIANFFGVASIKGIAENAGSLAKIIAADGVEKVLFFCGNLRRPELPDYLVQHKIEVTELVVYETHGIKQKVDSIYEGIIFFSPSAVDQFFIDNQTRASTVFFAIGDTTAAAIRKYTNNFIYTSPLAEKKFLIKEAIHHFLTTTKKTDQHGASTAK